ncbi:MAG: pantetheine-phosphate adenylyltransferase [Candidatus Nanohaloarchaea archaeon]|nr:pantetheine-phosphate adenylyltransferase [Candidatus Nanohaloarchaea archaeon]
MDTVYEPSAADREQLRTPRGTVVQGGELVDELSSRSFHRLIAVGDRVSLDCAAAGIAPDIAVVDGRIQRDPIDPGRLDAIPADRVEHVGNPAGRVTAAAWRAVREAVARDCSTKLVVDGEEDLLALPAVTFASPRSVVVYGQRDTGAVILDPDDAVKGFVEGLVGRRTHDHVIVGGSWDRFHAGHRSLLLAAFARGDHVDIGVTADSYLADKLDADGAAPHREREAAVQAFLDRYGLAGRATLREITGFRGNAVEDGDAIAVTPETRDGADRINDERAAAGRAPLDIIEVPLVTAADGTPISSSRIRRGEIDRDGQSVNS